MIVLIVLFGCICIVAANEANYSAIGASHSKVLFHTHHQKAIYQSTVMSDSGNYAIFADGRNINPLAYMGVIDLSSPNVTGDFVWSIRADAATAVTPRFGHHSAQFAAYSINVESHGWVGSRTVSLLAGFKSTDKVAPQYRNVTIPGTAFVIGAQMSSDGAVMAVAVATKTTCALHIFETHGLVHHRIALPQNSTCGPVTINHDGSIVMMLLKDQPVDKIAIFDGKRGFIDKVVPLKVSGSAFCMNHDGTLFSYGYSVWNLNHWDQKTNTVRSVFTGALPSSDWYLTTCTFGKNNVLVNAISDQQFNQNLLQTVDVDSKLNVKARWNTTLPKASTKYQDSLAQILTDDEGTVLLTVGWGDNLPKKVPTARLIDMVTGKQLWEFFTPGSMFTGDVVRLRRHHYRVTLGGKAVHANIAGYGGDAYAIDIVP